MIKIIRYLTSNNMRKETVLRDGFARETACKAIETIKNELPEEAQTVEVVKYIISEMKDVVDESKIYL